MSGPGTHEQAADSRARILREARRLFIERGYYSLSMREIAAQAGISKAGIYHHFKDKESLFLAVLTDSLQELEAIIRAAEEGSGPVAERVRHMARQIMSQPASRRAIIRLASQEMGNLSRAGREAFREAYYGRFIQRIQSLMAAGIAAGEFIPLNPMVMTWALLGLMYPYFYAAHARYIGPTPETVEQLLTIFLHGVAKSSPAQGNQTER